MLAQKKQTHLSMRLAHYSFSQLREKEQLAYYVECYDSSTTNKIGLLKFNIQTTTEDEETGEKSYDNVQKSINGFQTLINNVLLGDFSDEELNAIKLETKAELLRGGDHNVIKTSMINIYQNSPYGILGINLNYKLIDEISKEDIINAAKYIFASKPIFAITANKNTLEYNEKYLNQLEAN